MHYLHNEVCLFQELANLDEVELIQNDGSPCGSKYFLLWNPPLYMTEGSSKASSIPRRSRYRDICSLLVMLPVHLFQPLLYVQIFLIILHLSLIVIMLMI
jgi:ATP-dependent helicase YprA (DUF1998 family)